MEASSHGLDQSRLDGVRLTAAAFTNLTRDHLDYHGSLEAYRAAKLRLFTELLPEGAPALACADMDAVTLDALRDVAATPPAGPAHRRRGGRHDPPAARDPASGRSGGHGRGRRRHAAT